MIYHTEATFSGAGALALYCQSWQPEGPIRAVLLLVHGMGGHSNLFRNLVQHLVPRGYALHAFDLRGNGRSPGQRGYINAWEEFRGDLQAFVNYVTLQQPECPTFLLGHSVGSVVVLDYVLRCPESASQLQGVIVVSPIIGEVGVSPLRVWLGRALSRVYPRFSLSTGIDTGAGSRDPAITAEFAQDPLRHPYVTARFGTEFFATVAWLQAHAADWQLPLLVLHGDADRVALPEGGRCFFEHVPIADKEYKAYIGGYHEPFNDLNYQEVLADLETWLQRHLPNSSSRPSP